MRAALVRPRILTLVTTRQCTAACDHCCFGCSPQTTDRIPRLRLTRLIAEATEIESIRAVSFVGGECFLIGAELDDHFSQCRASGLEAWTTTNAYWAVSAAAAAARLERAAAAGLCAISISTGEMHARYVPVERPIAAAIAACDLGLETSITIETFLHTTFDMRQVTEHPAIADRWRTGRLELALRDWVPNADGNGTAQLRHDRARSRFAPDAQQLGCQVVLDDLTVTPQLVLAACCGYPVESIPSLALGSVREKTIAQAIESAPDDGLAFWLHVAGPERMLATVKRLLPDYELPVEAVDPCQVCLHLHRDSKALLILRELAKLRMPALHSAYEELSETRLAAHERAGPISTVTSL